MVQETIQRARPPIRLAEVLAAFSLATDLGIGRPMEHALRACYMAMQIAHTLSFSPAEQAELYYTVLLMHSGCSVEASHFARMIVGDEISAQGDLSLRDMRQPADMLGWMMHNVAPGEGPVVRVGNVLAFATQGPRLIKMRLAGFCEVGSLIASRLGMPPGVVQALLAIYETWDGKGPFALRGVAIPLPARIVSLVFILEPFIRLQGLQAAEQVALQRKNTLFDPAVVEAFLACAHTSEMEAVLLNEDLWQVALDAEPESDLRFFPEERLEDVVLAFSDVLDLKSPQTVGRSREAAAFAEQVARRLKLPDAEIQTIRRAALIQDLGLLAVPSAILEKTSRLNAAEQERMALHPYYSERILSRIPALREVSQLAGMHHERLDGSGYFRGLSGSQITLGVRILGLVDAYLAASRSMPGVTPVDALNAIKPAVGSKLDAACFEALLWVLGAGARPRTRPKSALPAGLTEREVEVLQWAAKGANNRQIALALTITEKTAGHHLEHIYNKIGVSSRAAAVFFAVEHELI